MKEYGVIDKTSAAPNRDWHVLYTRYLERITMGKVSGFTSVEKMHSLMVRKWLSSIWRLK